eukprot:gene51678-69153_t
MPRVPEGLGVMQRGNQGQTKTEQGSKKIQARTALKKRRSAPAMCEGQPAILPLCGLPNASARPELPDRLSIDARSPHHVRAVFEHDIGIHLDEATIAVPCKARIARRSCEAFYGNIVKPQIQNRIHHPRHRHPRARADRYEQRLRRVAEDISAH